MSEPRSSAYTTELDGIRAPLGVILYLIRRDNLDIYDIPIARITKEYLDYLDMMDTMQIELAGEFFVLAATLMRIKAQMLLRRDDETEDDPREGLVQSLLEYKKMVEAAKAFAELEDERTRVFRRPVPDAEKQFREEPTFDLSLFHLMKAFQEVMVRFEAADVREIELEEYTIEEKIEAVTKALREREQVLFTELFEAAASRMELIVTFMALLEMIKHGHIKSKQEGAFSSIWVYAGPNFGQKLESVEDWFEATGGEEQLSDLPHAPPEDARLKDLPVDETPEEPAPAPVDAPAMTDTTETKADASEGDDGRTEPR